MRLDKPLAFIGALAWIATLAPAVLGVTTPPDDDGGSRNDQAGPGEDAQPSTPSGEPAGNAAPVAPSTPRPHTQDWSHRLVIGPAVPPLPLQHSWVDFEAIQPGLFPGVRHHVRRWTSATTSWISPNSPSSIIPEPPLDARGPVACGCPPSVPDANSPPNVYGEMERNRLWTWCAVFFDLPGNSVAEQTHFIPDIWAGRGPCRALNRRGILHRFPADSVEQDVGGRYFIRPGVAQTMDVQSELDEGLIAQLWPSEAARAEAEVPEVDRRVFGGAATPEELRELWAAWVQTLLTRRGYILHDMLIFVSYRWIEESNREAWQRLVESEHFGPAPLGVWFYDTVTYAAQIRYYLTLGVPVYYRWEAGFFANPRLADLRPRDPPSNAALGMPNPPLSPHQPVNRRAQALWTHEHTRRAPPPISAATEDDVFGESGPEIMDDDEFEALSDQMAEIEQNWQRGRFTNATNGGPSRERGADGSPSPLPRGVPAAPALTGAGTSSRSLLERMSSVEPRLPRLLSRFDAESGPAGSSRRPTANAESRPRLLSRFDAGSGPAGSSRGPVAESRARAITSLAATPAGVHQEGFNDAWRFAVTADTPASNSFLDMLRAGQLPTHQERIGFSFTTGMPFATPVRRQPRAFDVAQSWVNHAVRDDWFITPTMTAAEQYARWRESAMRILARPHARAALLRGGILARIAVHFGLDVGHALRGPSDDARMNGTPFPLEDVDGAELWDDYLSADEVSILVGQVGVGGALTLFPRPENFATFWWNEGAWTSEHERWFLARVHELETARDPAGRSREAWRSALKRNQRYPQS